MTGDMLRSALVIMWLWSALAKLRSLDQFAVSARELARPVSVAFVRPAAYLLPFVEICLAGSLLINRWASPAAIVTALVLAGFAVLLLRAWRLRIATSCRCFGAANDDERVTGLTVTRTILLAIVAAVAAVTSFEGSHVLYRSLLETLGIWMAAGLLVAGTSLIGTVIWLFRQVEPRIIREGRVA